MHSTYHKMQSSSVPNIFHTPCQALIIHGEFSSLFISQRDLRKTDGGRFHVLFWAFLENSYQANKVGPYFNHLLQIKCSTKACNSEQNSDPLYLAQVQADAIHMVVSRIASANTRAESDPLSFFRYISAKYLL